MRARAWNAPAGKTRIGAARPVKTAARLDVKDETVSREPESFARVRAVVLSEVGGLQVARHGLGHGGRRLGHLRRDARSGRPEKPKDETGEKSEDHAEELTAQQHAARSAEAAARSAERKDEHKTDQAP